MPGSTVTTLPVSSALLPRGEPRLLVDLESDAVTQPVTELVAVPASSMSPRAIASTSRRGLRRGRRPARLLSRQD